MKHTVKERHMEVYINSGESRGGKGNVLRQSSPDQEGNRRVIVRTQDSKEVELLESQLEVKNKCSYCGKSYRYNLGIGDCNHNACYKPRCILQSMRDNL